jgi:hypothetical protein
MTSSKVGSFHSQEKERKMAYNNRTTLTVAPSKPSIHKQIGGFNA